MRTLRGLIVLLPTVFARLWSVLYNAEPGEALSGPILENSQTPPVMLPDQQAG